MNNNASSILNTFYKNLMTGTCDCNFKDTVVAISKNGVLEEEFLDEQPSNHATATCYVGVKLGFPYFDTSLNLVAGERIASYGIIVLQVHKDGICICFFPEYITIEQYYCLEKKLSEMKNFSFQYLKSNQEEGFVSLDNVLEYAKGIVEKDCNVLRKIK